jgi:hypothetical protein
VAPVVVASVAPVVVASVAPVVVPPVVVPPVEPSARRQSSRSTRGQAAPVLTYDVKGHSNPNSYLGVADQWVTGRTSSAAVSDTLSEDNYMLPALLHGRPEAAPAAALLNCTAALTLQRNRKRFICDVLHNDDLSYVFILFVSFVSTCYLQSRGASMRQPESQSQVGAPRGSGGSRVVVKEAWGTSSAQGHGGGDESFPHSSSPSPSSRAPRGNAAAAPQGRGQGRGGAAKQVFSTKSNVVSKASSSRDNDNLSSGEILRLAFYDPPASEEQLAGKLKLSFVGTPQITKVAFIQRSVSQSTGGLLS